MESMFNPYFEFDHPERDDELSDPVVGPLLELPEGYVMTGVTPGLCPHACLMLDEAAMRSIAGGSRADPGYVIAIDALDSLPDDDPP